MDIKIQRITKTAKLPTRSYSADTGYDIYVDSYEFDNETNILTIYTGIAIQPDPGFYCEVFPRSSVYKHNMSLANSVGVIDENYTGQIILKFYYHKFPPDVVVGEKIAQLVVRQRIDANFIEVSYLDNTIRGDGGFGSTGK
jgi:dUTP pyrophosphatase